MSEIFPQPQKERFPTWLVLLIAVCSIIGLSHLCSKPISYTLYIDAHETREARLTLVKWDWWGLTKEEFAVERENTPTGLRWVYYKPPPFPAGASSNYPKPVRHPIPYRVTAEWLNNRNWESGSNGD